MHKILKSRFYIYEVTDGGAGRLVKPELGAFKTESKAFNHMFEPAPPEKQKNPNQTLMERKPEFEDHYTVKGARILEYPHIYKVEQHHLLTIEEALKTPFTERPVTFVTMRACGGGCKDTKPWTIYEVMRGPLVVTDTKSTSYAWSGNSDSLEHILLVGKEREEPKYLSWALKHATKEAPAFAFPEWVSGHLDEMILYEEIIGDPTYFDRNFHGIKETMIAINEQLYKRTL